MLQDMSARLSPGDLVLDVGANIGNHALFLAAVAQARVAAFEPNRTLCEAFRLSVERNGLAERVSIRACGLGAAASRASFAKAIPTNLGQQTLRLGEGEIDVVPLDSLRFDAPVRMIKIDVEGMKLDVLRGGRETIARDRPILYVESYDEAAFRQIAAWAETEDYSYWETFNATPTHSFLPKERLSVEARLDKLNAREVVNEYRLGARLHNLQKSEAGALARVSRLEREAAEKAGLLADLREQTSDRIAALQAELEAERRSAAASAAEVGRMTELLGKERATLEKERAALEKERMALRARDQKIGRMEQHLAQTHAEIVRLHKYGLDVETKYEAILSSEAWRATEPARRLLQRLKKRPMPKPFVPQLRDYAPPPLPRPGDFDAGFELRASFLGHDPAVPRGERRVVFLATFPAREQNLPAIVDALLPQCDVLNVYLNEYEHVPEVLVHEKIRVTLGRNAAGDLKDNGKFFNCREFEDSYHVFVDDDIVYPPNYVETIVAGVRKYGFRAIVGFHGTIYKPPVESYLKDRIVLPFYAGTRAAVVDQLGTGTVGYHSSTFSAHLDAFETQGIADLWFARLAAERGVPMVALERPDHWLERMEEIGGTLFRQLERDDGRETHLLRDELVPALCKGPRPRMVSFMEALYTPQHLKANKVNMDLCLSGAFAPAVEARSDVHFALIITGWNCADRVDACLASIERQEISDSTLEIFAYDDGSDDKTWARLQRYSQRLRIRTLRGEANMGPAFARNVLLKQVLNPNVICVLLDMDDELLPHALRTLEDVYRGNPSCWMTYGNWINQKGVVNSEGSYTEAEINARSYRTAELFKFTHLRSFRRFLYDSVQDHHLQDEDGAWLRYCSDVGLILPIADQCLAENIVYVDDPIYIYHQYRPNGTQKLFGTAKKATFKLLCSRPALPPRTILEQAVEKSSAKTLQG